MQQGRGDDGVGRDSGAFREKAKGERRVLMVDKMRGNTTKQGEKKKTSQQKGIK